VITTPVLDIVSVDYIRLATWNWQFYLDLAARIRRKYPSWRKSKWLQYTMEKSTTAKVSYGCATQNDKGHGVFEASGIDAHVFYHWLVKTLTDEEKLKLYATRLDIQCTKARQEWLDYDKLYKRLRKPKRLILDHTGNTLYIGNRESDSFWRLYDKTALAVRLEVELKGNQAKGAWLFLSMKPDCIAELYSSHIKKSRIPNIVAEYYQGDIVPANPDDMIQTHDVDLETKFLWLTRLDSLVYKLANDHTLNERMGELLGRWNDYATTPPADGQYIDKESAIVDNT